MPDTTTAPADRSALLKSTALGTVAQLAMVVLGHSNAGVAAMYPTLGTTISGIAGLLVPVLQRGLSAKQAARDGAIAGGAAAVLGILASYFMGDVPLSTVALGGGMSALAGGIGGVIGRLLTNKSAA